MKKFLCVLFVGIGLLVLAGQAEASILSQVLNFDGSPQTIDDDSYGTQFDVTDGNGVTTSYIQGIISFDTTSSVGNIFSATGGNLYAAYSFALTADPNNPGSFIGSSAGAGFNAMDIFNSISGTGVSTVDNTILFDAGVGSDIVIFSDGATAGQVEDEDSWANANGAGAAINLDWIGANGTSFQVEAIAGLDASGFTFHNVGLFGPNTGFFQGAYNFQSSLSGNANEFLDVIPGAAIATSTQAGDPGLGFIQPTTQSGWDFEDEANFVLAPVPEPGALATWSILMLAGCRLRRRTQKS